jgi:hypothetical protein
MTELVRILLTALPFLLLALLGVLLWGPLRRMRERDKASPPSPRALALRALPFVALLIAGGIWGLVAQKYELVLWGVVGVLAFGYGLIGYSRHQKRQ